MQDTDILLKRGKPVSKIEVIDSTCTCTTIKIRVIDNNRVYYLLNGIGLGVQTKPKCWFGSNCDQFLIPLMKNGSYDIIKNTHIRLDYGLGVQLFDPVTFHSPYKIIDKEVSFASSITIDPATFKDKMSELQFFNTFSLWNLIESELLLAPIKFGHLLE